MVSDILGQVLVVSGGSGYNELVGATPNAIYVLPGSTSAAVAMKRPDNSCLSHPHGREALYALLSHRIPIEGPSSLIKQEWMEILEGKHRLWQGIDPEKRECVRGFLVQFESEVLHRAHRSFNFRGGSIGNFFLVAMQRFFRSIQSAIFLFSALLDIPTALPDCRVLPAINTNRTVTIAARLEDGQTIFGQCEISHPAMQSRASDVDSVYSDICTRPHSRDLTPTSSVNDLRQAASGPIPNSNIVEPRHTPLAIDNISDDARSRNYQGDTSDDNDDSDQASEPEQESMGNLTFSKIDENAKLDAPISRVFYVNSLRNEVFPSPNPTYLTALKNCRMMVYSCGSLWTSIIPCLSLRGLGNAIATSPTLRHKVLLLNSSHDRETRGMTATDFVMAITSSLNRIKQNSHDHQETSEYAVHTLVTHVVYLRQSKIAIDVSELETLGVKCVQIDNEDADDKFNEACMLNDN
ncbi:hypothetical protein MPSI1_001816 [Malassezia psittaci]|uniref:Uncharacterized protein n=1 Tax=Malassezia psittaci TaxID=1821823 RepID=A0AAF0FE76_9BASI|nr:hypothetical protein MPSI1_001816 [Malassezia psittaci]